MSKRYQPHQRRGAKSFVDDLGLSRGVVLSRAAASLRSIETKPFDSEICPLRTDTSPIESCGLPSPLLGWGGLNAFKLFECDSAPPLFPLSMSKFILMRFCIFYLLCRGPDNLMLHCSAVVSPRTSNLGPCVEHGQACLCVKFHLDTFTMSR